MSFYQPINYIVKTYEGFHSKFSGFFAPSDATEIHKGTRLVVYSERMLMRYDALTIYEVNVYNFIYI